LLDYTADINYLNLIQGVYIQDCC